MFDEFVQEILNVADDEQRTAYQQTVDKLADYFNGEIEVRCFVTNTDGFGHQISTVNMMKRLIDYGYSQMIRCVYDDRGNPPVPTIQKLKVLLPEIIIPAGGGIPAPINLDGCVVVFSPLSIYIPEEDDVVDFGFTGGYDDRMNLADRLMVNHFLVLQPFQWGLSHFSNAILRRMAATISLDAELPLQPNFNDRAFYSPDPTLTDAEWDRYFDTIKGAESAHLIYAFAEGGDPEELPINLCTAYGMSNVDVNIPLLASAETLLFNLITGIIQYVDTADISKRNPTVLLVLANVSHESYQEVQSFLAGDNLNNNVNTIQFLQDHNVNERVQFQLNGWDTQTLLNNIDALHNNQILVVSLPGLPPGVFDQMMYAANIPMVFEGKNAANLAINFPKPFLWLATNGAGVVYPTLPLGSPAGAQATANQANANTMQIMPRFWPSFDGTPQNPAQRLGEFMNNVYPVNPPTGFTGYFTGLSNFYHSQINDKLFMAMQAFVAFRGL